MPMLPAEIAEVLTPLEFIRLCSKIEHKFAKEFGVISVVRKNANSCKVVIEFADNTQETVVI